MNNRNVIDVDFGGTRRQFRKNAGEVQAKVPSRAALGTFLIEAKNDKLTEEKKFPRLHQIAALQAAQIDASCHPSRIPRHRVLAGLFYLIDERCDFTAAMIVDS